MTRRPMYGLSLLALILCLWTTALFHTWTAGAQEQPLATSPESGANTQPTPAPPAIERSPSEPGSELPTTSLASQDPDWLLVGTAVADDPAFLPFAVIEHQPSRTQRAYHEGSYLGEHAIKKILDGAVVVTTHTGDALLSMADGRTSAASSPSDQVARLRRREVESTLPDEIHLMNAIRVRPRFEAGQPGGFVIYSIEPDSIFARMGLQDGDVIAGVNGNSFTTTQPSLEFYNALKAGGTVSLEIKRGDSTQRLLFEIR